jgi:hypothetical protein
MPPAAAPDPLVWLALAAAALATLLFWGAVSYWTLRELAGARPLPPLGDSSA